MSLFLEHNNHDLQEFLVYYCHRNYVERNISFELYSNIIEVILKSKCAIFCELLCSKYHCDSYETNAATLTFRNMCSF